MAENRKWSSFRYGQGGTIDLDELSIYLWQYTEDKIRGGLDELIHSKHVRETRPGQGAYRLTARGERYYEEEVRERLGLREGESILDVRRLDSIKVFWVWQSDYKKSRREIRECLGNLVEEINREWRLIADVELDQAVVTGDGAVRIDVALLEKIRRSQFVVADLTPAFCNEKRLYPNANVLIEVGYALASLEPEQIFLIVEKERLKACKQESPSATMPFDIAHIHQIHYDNATKLQSRLKREFRSRMERRKLVRP